jgi:hypothetical protein
MGARGCRALYIGIEAQAPKEINMMFALTNYSFFERSHTYVCNN